MNKTATAPSDYQKAQREKQSRSTLQMAWRVAGVGWLALFATLAIIFYQQVSLNNAHQEVRNNTKVIYVKVYSDGTHEVSFEDGENNKDKERFSRPVIQASLINYVTKRFQVQPATIRADYGFALTYLGPTETTKFVEEFGAAQKAIDAEACKSCPTEEVEIRALRHEVYKEGKSATDGTVYDTTVYFTIRQRDPFTNRVIDTTDYLLDLQWTYLPQSGILEESDTIEFLSANPLGIEIISQEKQEDLTE